jgi:hypothetical protein
LLLFQSARLEDSYPLLIRADMHIVFLEYLLSVKSADNSELGATND